MTQFDLDQIECKKYKHENDPRKLNSENNTQTHNASLNNLKTLDLKTYTLGAHFATGGSESYILGPIILIL